MGIEARVPAAQGRPRSRDRGEGPRAARRGGREYRLENDGRDVLVDVKDYEKAQATFVQNQIITGDDAGGYRALDSVSFGLTEEQQKLRMRIALEEEIARSLRQFEGVEVAKVHLTAAERSFTRRDSAPAKASVILRLRQGKVLDDAQGEAITRLVANASPGLLPENVILTDTRGTLLSHGGGGSEGAVGAEGDPERARTTSPTRRSPRSTARSDPTTRSCGSTPSWRPRRSTRRRRSSTARTRSRSRRRCRAPRTTRRRWAGRRAGDQTKQDPTLAVAKGGGSKTEDVATTFDYPRTTTHTTREKSGIIKRLTVGVLVDESLLPKRKEIEDIVTGAVGVDLDRKDVLNVAFVPFAARPKVEEPAAPAEPSGFKIPPVIELVKWGVTGVVALVVGFVILRSIRAARASMRVAFSETHREQKPELRRIDPAEQISEEIARDAQSVGRLLRNWLYETSSRN